MFRYVLLLAYDGGDFHGWQTQRVAPRQEKKRDSSNPLGKERAVSTVQETLSQALRTVCADPSISVFGSGRTDAGVHARGQVAHFDVQAPLHIRKVLVSLKRVLPASIRPLALRPVPASFHACRSACRKTYVYQLFLAEHSDPFLAPYVLRCPPCLDLDLLQKASRCLLGTHDFASFANLSPKKNTVRSVHGIKIRRVRPSSTFHPAQEGSPFPLYLVSFTANGFLHKMVRTMMQVLIDIATNKKNLLYIPYLFQVRDRRQAGHCAPPHALFLEGVEYEAPFKRLFP